MAGIPFEKLNGEITFFEIPDSDYLFLEFLSDAHPRRFINMEHVGKLLRQLELANRELNRLGASEEFLEKTKVAGDETGNESDHEHDPLKPEAPVLKL